jgi:predicted double-glycine peptidase
MGMARPSLASAATLAFFGAFGVGALAGAPAFAQQAPSLTSPADFQTTDQAGGPYHVHAISWRDMPFRTVIRQQYDFSCGSAALATLLRYQYGVDVDESQIFKAMWALGDHKEIQAKGFSLADMKRYLTSRGMGSDGYRVPLERYAQAQVPGIAVINIGGYKHFVVVKSIRDGEVLVGDPAIGLHAYTYNDFKKTWDGLIFVIHDDAHPNNHHGFDSPVEWAMLSPSPTKAGEWRGDPFSYGEIEDQRTVFQVSPTTILAIVPNNIPILP